MAKKLYLLPGTMCNEKLWTQVLPYLHDSPELVYLEIPRGKGIKALAEYYNQLLEDDALNLIGFSLGGYIAAYFSVLYPERMEKLFIISNSPTQLPVDELNQRRDTLNFVKKYGYKGMTREKAATMFDAATGSAPLIDLVLKMAIEQGEANFISQYQYTSQRIDLCQAISRLPFATHLYYSEKDRLINVSRLNELKNSSPYLTVKSTPGSGHMLPLEKPQELAAHINAWLAL